MKLVAEYLEHAVQFERMAEQSIDQPFKESLLAQAVAYRKLAEERSVRLGLLPPKGPSKNSN